MSAKHTPGPWRVHLNVPAATIPGHIIKADHGAETPVASLWKGGGSQGKEKQIANAHLIAAAPELLAELKAALTVIEECDPDTVRMYAPGIRAAIAKAEGRAE